MTLEDPVVGKTHLTRRELLKQDEFLISVTGTWVYIREHAHELLIGACAVVGVTVIVLGIFWFVKNRRGVSNEEISSAIQLYNSPLITEQSVSRPTERVFATAQEKYAAAEREFARLSRKYSGKTGQTATYYDALCKYHLGDATTAIQQLSTLTKGDQGEIGALAKFALAEIYAAQKNTTQVTTLLQQLIDNPATTVPKLTAMMALAEYHEQNNNKEAAIQLYKKIQMEFPSSSVQGEVSSRLADLGAKS
jgi:predicted negative regulator of RcsB-dependent stress response